MKYPKNIAGQRFGKLLVLARFGIIRTNTTWLVRCDCGTEKVLRRSSMVTGNTTSCGCKLAPNPEAFRRMPAHRVWHDMKARCTRSTHKDFKYYGGRGIKVCARWIMFANFLSDMGQPPKGLTLERINNDGNYEPSNCRWATRAEQMHNRRDNRPSTQP